MKSLVIDLLRFYGWGVSPYLVRLFGNACRFTPTCSEYTIEAVEKFGTVKGMGIGTRRFLRCHPWGRSGYDPVPTKV